MAMIRIFAPALKLALIGIICLIGIGPTLLAAQDREAIKVAAGDVSEKEAFEAAKELGTIEAWEAFLTNFSTGFRADLARAYVNQLGVEKPDAAQAGPQEPVKPAPTAAAPQSPADLSVTITPNQASCNGGGPCSYTVVATNVGGKPFARQSVIAVGLTPGASRLVSSPGPWSCQGMAGGAVCFNPNPNLGSGQSATIPITFGLRPGGGGSLRSCAQISWGGAPSSSSVRDVQQALNQRGFNAGPADGQAGRKTVQAIRNFQGQNGLPATGEVDLALLFNLFTQRGPGDANASNDQACIQTALTGSPPVAVRSAPAQRKKSTKKRGCPSGTVFLEGQCVKRSEVTAFCGPGYKRSGTKCVSRYPAASGQAQVPPRQTQPNPGATIGGVAAQIINQVNQQRQCSGGRVQVGGKCRCPAGQTFSGTVCVQNRVQQQTVQQAPAAPVVQAAPNAPPAPPPPQPIIKKKCPGGLVPNPNGGCSPPSCGPGQIATPNGCVNLSDARLKRDVHHLATRDDGIKLYAFRYHWSEVAYVGVLAQDLLSDPVHQGAVVATKSGYYAVDYGKLGVEMRPYADWQANQSAQTRRSS